MEVSQWGAVAVLLVGVSCGGRDPAERDAGRATDAARAFDAGRTPDAAGCAARPLDADSSTIALYHLDEGTGTTTADAGDGGLDGVLDGAPEWVAGRFGSGLRFGEDRYDAVVIDPASIEWGDALSVELWVWSSDSDGGEVVLTGVERVALWLWSGGTLRLYGCANSPATSVGTESWHYIAGTYDGTALRTHLDGILIDSIDGLDCDPLAATDILRIGDHFNPPNNLQFDGVVDEIRISSVARSDQEIAQAYCADL